MYRRFFAIYPHPTYNTPMKKLVKGIVAFRETHLADYRDKYARLVKGQNPDVLFIACCDSRVVPNTFASSDPGDLFVHRNIGNIVPPLRTTHTTGDTSSAATIEFAVNVLKVKHIIVCGHSECGAMQFFTKNSREDLPQVTEWLHYAHPSYERYLKAEHHPGFEHLSDHNKLSQINVLQQLDHLMTYPEVAAAVQAGSLALHAWWFDIETADVCQYEASADAFLVIDEAHAERMLAPDPD